MCGLDSPSAPFYAKPLIYKNKGDKIALFECSECYREISSKAAFCPGCGNPVVGNVGSAEESSVELENLDFLGQASVILIPALVERLMQMEILNSQDWVDIIDRSLGVLSGDDFINTQEGIGAASYLRAIRSLFEDADEGFDWVGASNLVDQIRSIFR